ncbi:glycosyltransferase [Terrabacter sp. Ter38]|uniref:glycosyltransferase family 2 protein n=1 Tax=Terrabacter sp. Ter38 TaxID=2926030 RepID=UPI002117AAD6|nr:glycosyltransferase [Terrabacter sp. Ter38]
MSTSEQKPTGQPQATQPVPADTDTRDPVEGAELHPTVVVGMATYQRNDDMARTVPLLVAQVAALRGASGTVVVIDNDPEGGARKDFERLDIPGARYVHERRPGISAARNRAIDEAEGADALVFIDDDEIPDDGWLQSLLDSWKAWGCAAVTGPVTSVFVGEADDWVRASGLFDRAHRTTGALNPGASSANLLLDLAALKRHNIRFDEQFGLSGGSDTMLAHALRGRGEQIRWCQEASVTEFVPAARSRRRWVFTRTMRTSNTWSRVAVVLARQDGSIWRARAELTARGGYRIARGSARRALARLRRDVPGDARGAVDVASGFGILMGAYGAVRYEYLRPVPSGRGTHGP